MNKTTLRLRGWISALRPFALMAGVIGLLSLIGLGINVYRANQAVNSPEVKIGQLVSGEIGANQYVTITGYIIYGGFFEQTDGDKLVAVVNPVIDMLTGEMIFVRFTNEDVRTKEGEEAVTLSGKTAVPDAEFTQLILDVLPDLEAVGLRTTSFLYIDNVLQPGQINRTWLQIGVVGVVIVLGAAIYAMPGIVFNPEPLAVGSSAVGVSLGNVQVSGKLFKSVKNNPFEATGRKRHFSRANANLIKDASNGLIVAVHHVVTYRTYGIKTGQAESDWLVKLTPYQVVRIEPGKLYTFIQHQAVRIVYKAEADKQAVLVLSFETDQDQAACINLLKEMGFAVQWLGYVNTI